jgi:hypothetical protein
MVTMCGGADESDTAAGWLDGCRIPAWIAVVNTDVTAG